MIVQKDQVLCGQPLSQIDDRFYRWCQFGVVICVQFLFTLQNAILTIDIINFIITGYPLARIMATQTQPSFFGFIKHNPIVSAFAVGSLSAAVLYYMTKTPKPIKVPVRSSLKKRTKNQPATEHNFIKQQQQIQHELNHLKSTREKLIAAAKDFKIEFLQQEILTSLLTEQCLLNIFDNCIQLVDDQELNRIYETSRKARRTIFSKIYINAQIKQMNRKQSLESLRSQDPIEPSFPTPIQMTTPRNLKSIKHLLQNNTPISYPQALTFSQMYYRFVCTFEEEFKYLIEKTQKDFAAFLNIDFSLITQSIDFHISKENNQYFKQKIEEWTATIRELLKNKLVNYVSPIDPNKIREILTYQVRYLHEKREKLRETIQKLGISNEQELEALPTLLATILQDEVFFRFGIQQEQMTVEMMHLSKNKELEALVEEFQLLTEDIAEEMYEEVNKDAIMDDSADDV